MDAGPAPRVSIIIPAYNCVDMTRACLDSIAEHTRDVDYEIILVDDASDPEAAAAFRALAGPRTRLLRNETRQCYSYNNNQAARVARGEYLCLLNNDTLVTAGWLKAMVDVMEREPDIGVLGNKHLFPESQRLHHL